MVIIDESDYIAHYGTPRHSGRYPWGSGGNDEQMPRGAAFLDYVDNLYRQGLSEKEVAAGFDIPIIQLRAKKTIAKAEKKQAEISMAQRLHDKGMGASAIARQMNVSGESYVRSLLAPGEKDKADILTTTTNMLKAQIEEKKYLDVGKYVENYVGISNTRFKVALEMMQEDGYKIHNPKTPQLGTGLDTTRKIMTKGDVTFSELMQNKDKWQQIQNFSDDHGRTMIGLHPPIPISPHRVEINYAETGGGLADGVIYVREGVPDVSLGNSRYAQVRIQVGPDHYLKGMAMYKADLPPGVDLVFNTNKTKAEAPTKLDAMKPIKEDPTNPFGSNISRQLVDVDANGKQHVTSVMNIVNEEGDWHTWSKTVSSQVLSKQRPQLAKAQLDMTYENKQLSLKDISALTNPTIKKKMLLDFADATDASAVHLEAAALPGQNTHIILPIPSLPPSQVYAPQYNDGERVALIRYPHGGTFEIPELTVNNNHVPAKKALGTNPIDAIGIHPTVAERLSGADFDGDTVLVIRNDTPKRLGISPALEGLKNFDPRTTYKKYEGMPVMTKPQKQQQMGNVSNLITDMTIKGANTTEIAAAIRHSMVVIDAEKHELNYKQSYIDNGIAKLKEKYQGGKRAGASTLISRASSEKRVDERKPRRASKGGPIDPVTGRKVFEETGRLNFRTGKPRTTMSKKLAETTDAFSLVSGDGVGTRIERVYAEHSNKLKALANKARLEALNTPRLKYSPSAKVAYQAQVDSLNHQLFIAQKHAPLERQAQTLANTLLSIKRANNPNMDDDAFKKARFQSLNEARIRTGAAKHQIIITQDEWNAIQQGAISDSKLTEILRWADNEVVREFATPQKKLLMTSSKTTRAKQMAADGYTRAEIAANLGVSLTTLETALT